MVRESEYAIRYVDSPPKPRGNSVFLPHEKCISRVVPGENLTINQDVLTDRKTSGQVSPEHLPCSSSRGIRRYTIRALVIRRGNHTSRRKEFSGSISTSAF